MLLLRADQRFQPSRILRRGDIERIEIETGPPDNTRQCDWNRGGTIDGA